MRKAIIRHITPLIRDGTLKAIINYVIGFHPVFIQNHN